MWKDLIHRSSSFGTRLDGIHREEECEKQRSLNKQFSLKYRANKVEREVNRAHASPAEPDGQAPGSAPDTTSRIEIVRLPTVKPRVKLPLAPVDENEEESDIRHSDDTTPVVNLPTSQTHYSTNGNKETPNPARQTASSLNISNPQTQISPAPILPR
jgi:hypothetical protein